MRLKIFVFALCTGVATGPALAQVFTDAAAFDAARGDSAAVTESFPDEDPGVPLDGTSYPSGLEIEIENQTENARVTEGRAFVVIAPPDTGENLSLTLRFPVPTTFFSMMIGGDGGLRGIGNGPAVRLVAPMEFDFREVDVEGLTEYSGFFGIVSDVPFTEVVFRSAADTAGGSWPYNDDFLIDDITFAAP